MTSSLEDFSKNIESVSDLDKLSINGKGPLLCGDIDIKIDHNGVWHYMGTPILRQPLVKLFSSVLKIEDGEYFLVTPIEKMRIKVDDVPFIVIDIDRKFDEDGLQIIEATTNVGYKFVVDEKHGMFFNKEGCVSNNDKYKSSNSVYVHVHDGLEARFDRKSYYRLVDFGEEILRGNDVKWFGVRSKRVFFPFAKSLEL